MSGIVALVDLTGAPVDRGRLHDLTESLRFRGPDARWTWADGPVGFGHTLLRTTGPHVCERQPLSLDGEVWIAADARLDDRPTLVSELEDAGHTPSSHASDAELLLHAYRAWGSRLVDHLLGDFAFMIWDGDRRELLCARDHFGVKPFYYAMAGRHLVLSNTLRTVRRHPAVTSDLDDLAIADFLLFGYVKDADRTSFAHVRRLPPAHMLRCVDGRVTVSRFWTLPEEGRIRFRCESDYVEGFAERFDRAVGDRLPAGPMAISMSGGMDSSAVAAVAGKLLDASGRRSDLTAHTSVYDRVPLDEERRFAQMAADHIGIPIRFLAADDYDWFEHRDDPGMFPPQPGDAWFPALYVDFLKQIEPGSRVLLDGEGADPLFSATRLLTGQLVRSPERRRLVARACWHCASERVAPPLGIRTTLRTWRRRRQPLPAWVSPDLARRFDLKGRIAADDTDPRPPRSMRPEAYRRMLSPFWSSVFERGDPEYTQRTIEQRHPFFDLRVVEYMLAVPPIPLCRNKMLLRSAMATLLPKAIVERPKAPLAPSPTRDRLGSRHKWIDAFQATQQLGRYVVRANIPTLVGESNPGRLWSNIRPFALNLWLRSAITEGLAHDARTRYAEDACA